MGAPTGNDNAKKGKEWFDALRKVCVQKKALAKIAETVVDKAIAGEAWAIAEVANRFDGKPAQAVTVAGDKDNPLQTSITVSFVERSD